MNRHLVAVLALLMAFSTAAIAAPMSSGLPGEYHPDHRDVVVQVDESQAQILSPEDARAAGYYLLYVNRCVGGATITRASFEDSRTNSSTIIQQTTTFPAYPGNDSSWNLLMENVRSILSPFGVEITDQDPGDTPHTEIISCGRSFLGPSVLGVAPFGCGLVANAIGYAFAEEHFDERQLAETIAHEAGHTWTLNHLYDCADPMTYLTGCGNKSFQNSALSCAEASGGWQRAPCSCGGSTQNSYQTLLGFFGPNNNSFPTLNLELPADGALVGPSFPIRGSASGTNGGESIAILIDDVLVLRLNGNAIETNGPNDISDGPHELTVAITDQFGRSDESKRSITVSSACQCEDTEYCDGDKCLPFGKIGDSCTVDSTCLGGLCGHTDDADLCTSKCTMGADECPNGTECIPAGEGGLCWEKSDSGSCGCQSSGGTSGAIWTMLFLLFILSQRRTRRRSMAKTKL